MLSLKNITRWTSSDISSKARALAAAAKSLSFLVSLHTAVRILCYTRPLAVKLQPIDQDMLGAIELINAVSDTISTKRNVAENVFKNIYTDALAIRESNNAHAQESPIISARETEEFLRRELYIPLVDDVLSNIKQRFTRHAKQAMEIARLIPRNVQSSSTNNDEQWLEDVVTFYKQLMPLINNFESVRGEWEVWKSMWVSRSDPQQREQKRLRAATKGAFQLFTPFYKSIPANLLQRKSPVRACINASPDRHDKAFRRRRCVGYVCAEKSSAAKFVGVTNLVYVLV